jgi:hypothetical protein
MVDVTIKTQRSKTAQARSDHMERLKDEQALPQIKVVPAKRHDAPQAQASERRRLPHDRRRDLAG